MKKNDAINQVAERQRIEFSSDDFKIVVLNQLVSNFPKSFHEEIEIKYYYETGSKIMIGNDIYNADKGDIIVINPYEIHANVNINNTPIRYYSIVVAVDFNSLIGNSIDLRKILIEDGKKFNNLIKNDERLQTLISRAFDEMQRKSEHYRLVVRALMLEFFVILLRDYVNGNESRKEGLNLKQAEIVRPALSKIHADFNKKITIEELADICNISKYHFCRVFNKVMAVSPVEYLISYRLKIADIMLKDSNETISTIAEKCGFEDKSYFCRCYKKHKGISPKKSRNSK
ncbi:MAG: helix-turn-helix transcriptional regulator [Clostridia bacterium]|nr:helix-turn-helix transcriptional regulator [Clostridia bacterium]